MSLVTDIWKRIFNRIRRARSWPSVRPSGRFERQPESFVKGSSVMDVDASFLAGGGEMGQRIRELDWSRTSLGVIETWPQSLRSALSICLNSSFPIAIYWGRDLHLLYNDEWSPIPGEKHPWALGRPACEAWPEIWHIIEPLFQRVMNSGDATRSRDQLLPMRRHGFTEECYFDYTFSPIRGESGQVEGVFNAVLETTTRVIGERRLRTLRELGDWKTDAVRTVNQACQAATHILAENPHDLPFSILYLVSDDGRHAIQSGQCGLGDDHPDAPAVIDLDSDGSHWHLSEVLRTGKSVEVQNLQKKLGPLPGGAWPEPPDRALVLPMAKSVQSQVVGFVVAGTSPRLALNDEYRGFLELLAGHIAAAVANARAYDEERRRADALAELDRAKTTFFSNVSHEFRTPLTLILGPVEELLAQPCIEMSAKTCEMLSIVRRNGLRLQRLVNSLLDFSRLEAGRVQATFEPINLAELTADLASNFRSACEKAGLQFHVDCPPLSEPVFVDRQMYEQVVLNLLSNAFKFTFHGRITVSIHQVGDFAELQVLDTGIGIPPDEMPHLFERFHRVETSNGRTHEGSGIGLALVHELVKLHGGNVTAKSEVGRGTTFTISIPLGSKHFPSSRLRVNSPLGAAVDTATPFVKEALRSLPHFERAVDGAEGSDWNPIVAADQRSRTDVERPVVLIADDNADMRQYITRLLGEDYRVEAVENGEAALLAARRQTPSLIVSDVMMPRLDGFGLLRELRADPRTASVPVILLSARAGEESRVEGLEGGADDYLVKPFSSRELVVRVGAILQINQLRRESEQAIRNSEERFRVLFETMNEGFAIVEIVYDEAGRGLDLRYLEVNPAFERQTGRNGPEIVGRTMLELFANTAPQCIEQFAMVATSGTPVNFQAAFGQLGRWFEVSAYRTGPNQVATVFFDVTDRKRTEEQLAEAHQFLNSSLDALSSHIAVLDQSGTILAVNEAWRRFANENQFAGKNYGIGTNYVEQCQPDSSECIETEMVAGLKDVLAGRKDFFEFEYPCNSPSQQRWFVMRATRFRSPGPVRVVVSHTDITARKCAEESVRASETRFRLAADAVNGIIYEYDIPSGKVERTRGLLEVVGYRPEEVPATADWWWEQMHPEDRLDKWQAVRDAARLGRGFVSTYRVRHKDGRWLFVEDRSVVIADAAGEPIKLVGCTTDVTQRVEAEDELRQADRCKDEFLATLAHELRNPLAPIRNGLQIIRLASRDLEAVEQARTMMERQLSQLVHLVDDLLDLSRISRGKIELRKERIELAHVIQQAIETCRPGIEQAGHELTIAMPPDPIYVDADTTRLTQVFSNILNNAAKYTDRGGRVSLKVELSNGEVLVSVKDSGVGIPSQMLPRVFDMFTQVDRNLERSQGGLGIGLSIVKRLVEMHGGTVKAKSDGHGMGSEFVVSLPVVLSLMPFQKDITETAWKSNRRRVLVADDNRDAASSLTMMLKLMGNDVKTANDGLEALDVAAAFRPDLILLDIGMPRMNGHDAARHIREQPWGKNIVLVALTGWGQDEDRNRSQEAGFDAHMVKPIEPSALEKLLTFQQSETA